MQGVLRCVSDDQVLRVVEKIKQIVREEMNGIDGQEMLATSMQSKEVWEKTNKVSG